MVLDDGGREVRFDASARYPGALEDLGSRPRLVFSQDEAGRRAFDAVRRVTREGGRATIPGGLGTIMEAVPVGLRGLLPEGGLWGEVEIVADQQPVTVTRTAEDPMQGPMIVRCGQTELGMVLFRKDAPEGWEHAVHGATGGLELLLTARRGVDGQVEVQPDWRFTRGEGSGREQLLATRIMLAALDGDSLKLLRPEGDRELASGVMERPEDSTEWHESLTALETFLSYVAEVEAWLGRELFPPRQPTEDDAQSLGAILSSTREPETEITWRRVEMGPGTTAPDGDGPWRFAFLQPLHAELFGEPVYVGMRFVIFPEGRISVEGDQVAIVPVAHTGRGTSRLYRPDEVPPEAAQPPTQSAI